MNKIKTNKRKGFTLIELVIVVAIIGILSLMIIPQFNNVTEDAREKTWRSNCTTVSSAVAMYQAGHNGDFPADKDALKDYIAGGAPADGNPEGSKYNYTKLEKGEFSATFTKKNKKVVTYNMSGDNGGFKEN